MGFQRDYDRITSLSYLALTHQVGEEQDEHADNRGAAPYIYATRCKNGELVCVNPKNQSNSAK